MNLEIAKHLRIAVPSPTDDFVEKRKKAVNDLAVRFRKRSSADQFVMLASALTGLFGRETISLPPGDLRNEVASAIVKNAPSFVADESTELEMAICAILGAAQIVVGAQADGVACSKPTWLAAALVSGLSFSQERTEPQVEALRIDIIRSARDFLARNGEVARRRSVPSLDSLPRRSDNEDTDVYLERLVPVLEKSVSLINVNAKLDREEIDLLWWALNDWSEMLSQRFSLADPRVSALISSIEFANLLAQPPVGAHRDLAVRNLRRDGSKIPLLEFSELDNKLLNSSVRMLGNATASVRAHPLIFPFLWVVVSAAESDGELLEKARRAGLCADVSLGVDDWARRALDEVFLLKMMGHSLGPLATVDGD